MSERAAERRQTAEERVESAEAALERLEQEILDEVAAIDADWDEKARAMETVELRPEASDVRVTDITLVWVPTT